MYANEIWNKRKTKINWNKKLLATLTLKFSSTCKSPMCEQHQLSPNNITIQSREKVMSINKMITTWENAFIMSTVLCLVSNVWCLVSCVFHAVFSSICCLVFSVFCFTVCCPISVFFSAMFCLLLWCLVSSVYHFLSSALLSVVWCFLSSMFCLLLWSLASGVWCLLSIMLCLLL